MAQLQTHQTPSSEKTVSEAAGVALAWAARRRTTLPMALHHPLHVLGQGPALDTPLWLWRDNRAVEPFDAQQIAALRQFVAAGGSLWIDAPDGATSGPFITSVLARLKQTWPETPLIAIAREHVLFKSFYLIEGPVGRHATSGPPMGMTVGGRLAIFLTDSDVMGAIATRSDGTPMLPLSAKSASQREMSLRLGVNWLMYTLCLDYKDDQVHLPYLLKRRT